MVGENGKPLIVINEESFSLEIRKIDELTKQLLTIWLESTSKKIHQLISDEKTVEEKHETEAPTTIPAEVPRRPHKRIHKEFIELSEKHCKRCAKTKPIKEFNKSKADRTGHQSYCRVCSNEINRGNKKIRSETIKSEKQPETPLTKTGQEPVKTESKKTLSWTKERDAVIRDNFKELGVSGIYDKSMLPGFTMTEIRRRCQDLHLLDDYGNLVEKKKKDEREQPHESSE